MRTLGKNDGRGEVMKAPIKWKIMRRRMPWIKLKIIILDNDDLNGCCLCRRKVEGTIRGRIVPKERQVNMEWRNGVRAWGKCEWHEDVQNGKDGHWCNPKK
jgi:hypothetical protein